jgi:pimeloyl-ACP methyl ester carboxylesterase
MASASVNGLRLYYEQEGTGPPLVLLSGATMALDSALRGGWASLRPYLAQRFQVVQFDQRGHGRTDNPGGDDAYSLAALAADAAALIEQLGLAPVHVAGWSEGGIVGLGLALDHPSVLRSLIGIGTNYTNDARTVAQLATLDPDALERDRPTAATGLAQRHDPHHDPGYWKKLLRWIVTSETDLPACTAADLARITQPTLWIAGEDDPWFELSQPLAMKQHIPRAELLIVNCAGHAVQQTHPHLVGPVMTDFFARHNPSPSTAG